MSEAQPSSNRILVADDEATTLVLFRAALSGQGPDRPTDDRARADAAAKAGDGKHEPNLVLCSQGDEALGAVEEAVERGMPFAVAFLDVSMPPGPDGVWTAERIRAIDPRVHLVMVTALTDVHPEEIARRVPPREKLLYLQKPLGPTEIQSFAAALCAKWNAEQLVEAAQRELEARVERRTADLTVLTERLQQDIAERERVEEALRKSETSLARAQEMAHLGSWELDLASGALRCSEEVRRLFGFSGAGFPETMGGYLQLVHPDDRASIEEWLDTGFRRARTFTLDHRIVRPDGVERIVNQLIEVVDDEQGRPTELTGAVQDITELRRSEEQILYQAFHDALTGLPNRLLFNDRLRVAIAHARRRRHGLTVLFLDLDNFKTINDSLGHAIGDQLLEAVAGRLVTCVRDEDTVARLGGDEFIMLLQDSRDPNYAVQVAERMLKSLSEPFPLAGHELHTTASIGITLYPEDGDDLETIISNADIAMYRAKDDGRNCCKLFTASMNIMVMERMALEVSLRQGLKNRELRVHYQPVADIGSGQIVAVEALVRWQRPGKGLVLPEEFIPLAEETGLIMPLGAWVLSTACSDAKRWHDQGLEDLLVSVNLSPRQFQHGNLVTLVRNILEETGLPPHCLVLELTEGAVMHDVEDAIKTMRLLSESGVKLSMDDFGRGYSSLYHLKRFPMDTLKIDGSFVNGLVSGSGDPSIVKAIISMGRSLGLNVIAEGVETFEQLDFLRDHHCDQVQGFLLERPLPAEEVTELLRRARPLFEGHEDPDT